MARRRLGDGGTGFVLALNGTVVGRTLKLVVSYDGTDFHGWQIQPGQRTVEGVLEEALSEVVGEPVDVAGAGRTDAGVHARGQCATFTTASRLPARAFPAVVKRHLPPDVRVLHAEEREEGFHARHSARARRYAYRLLDRDDLLSERTAWAPRELPSPEGLERATRVLEGEWDCASFASAGGTATTTVCRIHRARWRRWERGLCLDAIADHFLYHMVRTIVGTALDLARTDDPEGRMKEILEARDRSRAGVTAPARGLCLEEVFYPVAGEAR